MMVAFNYFGGVVCWLFVTIIASIAIFKLTIPRWGNKVWSKLLAIIVFIAVLVGIPVTIKGVSYSQRGNWQSFSADDVQGIWTASYEKYGCWQFTGIEILIFNSDFTYEQLFIDGDGNRQHVAQSEWRLVDQSVFLEAAKRLPYYFSENECDQIPDTPLNSLITFQEKDLELHIWSNLFADDGIMLETKPAGDPDAPEYTRYFKSEQRLSTPINEPFQNSK